MGRYIRSRLITAIPVFFGITLLVFLMVNLAPGTITDLMGEGAANEADRAALEQVGVGMRDHLIFVDGDMVSLKQTERSRGRQYYQLERPGDWE